MMRPYIAQIRSNLRLMGRDRAVLFFSYIFPLIFFFIFAQIFRGAQSSAAMGMIIAAVVNSAQEAGILTQILYLPMLFLSGATFPTSIMPTWVQSIAQFMPATYLYQGMQSIMIGGESLGANLLPVIGLTIT